MRRVTSVQTPVAHLVGPGKIKVVNGQLAYATHEQPPLRLDPQRSPDNNERLVRIFMMMPDEISLQFHNFELVVVHLRNDLRLPLLLEQPEFLTEVDGLIAHCIALPREIGFVAAYHLLQPLTKGPWCGRNAACPCDRR